MMTFHPQYNILEEGEPQDIDTTDDKSYRRETEDLMTVSGEYNFIIDRSGSMSGTYINTAKEALKLFIKSLPFNSKFNVISFGSRHEFLYKEAKAAED